MKRAADAAPTVDALLEEATQRLETAGLHFGHGTHNAYDEAAWIMLHVLEAPEYALQPYLARRPNTVQRERFLALVERRIRERIPTAYLLNEAWLGKHRFYVDERVIVPRSFIAELLARDLAPWLKQPESVASVLDLCTGSGCLAILAALSFAQARVTAVDLSEEALEIAQTNVAAYGLQKRVEVLRSDMFGALGGRRFDLILSNPPYVNAPSMRALPREYGHEPRMALASGRDGLDATRAILREAAQHLTPTGLLIVEIGHNRAALERAFSRLDFRWLKVSAGEDYVFLLDARQLTKTA